MKSLVLLIASLIFVSCGQNHPLWSSISGSAPKGALAPELPATINGVNMMHLDGEEGGVDATFVQDLGFEMAVTSMGWNTYRLPVAWSTFADAKGYPDAAKIAVGVEKFRHLLSALKKAHTTTASKEKFFLLIDFHQFKFGGTCGADGVPAILSDHLGLDRNDPNCTWKAFHHFWSSKSGLQEGWIHFATQMLKALLPVYAEHKDWLTLGIEPMNEPQPGTVDDVFTTSWPSPVRTALNLESFFEDSMTKQVDQYLLPFLRQFLYSVDDHTDIGSLAGHVVFVFEPFVWDHLSLKFNVSVLGQSINVITIEPDGRYDGLKLVKKLPRSGMPIHWVAAPHHYDGTLDGAVDDALPETLMNILKKYPNQVFNRDTVISRLEHQRKRMMEAGAYDVFIGEYGTPSTLLQPDGSEGGWRTWIKDTHDGFSHYMRGGLWWRYEFDNGEHQTWMALLQGPKYRQEQSQDQFPGAQRLKCDAPNDIARVVYGRCPSY